MGSFGRMEVGGRGWFEAGWEVILAGWMHTTWRLFFFCWFYTIPIFFLLIWAVGGDGGYITQAGDTGEHSWRLERQHLFWVVTTRIQHTEYRIHR